MRSYRGLKFGRSELVSRIKKKEPGFNSVPFPSKIIEGEAGPKIEMNLWSGLYYLLVYLVSMR